VLRIIRKVLIFLFVLYLALFGVTKLVRYPEPISAIRLGLAPASKTPDLMPGHWIVALPKTPTPWRMGTAEVPTQVTWENTKISFDDFLSRTHTNAFVIVRNGKITYQTYLNGKTESSRLPSYSVAKTMTSIVIGQLIEAGKIKESDTLVSILPRFKAGTDFDRITIKDLLDMQGGIGVMDNYPSGPSGWGVAIAQMYASTDLNWFLDHNRKMKELPGTVSDYRSIDTQLLGMIITKVTGQHVADYFTSHIWQPIGAEFDALWNVDHKGGQEKTFCCFNAAARDYARVGQLLLENGGGVISATWIHRLSTPTVTLDHNWGYGAQIWHPYPGVNMMEGLHGQYVYVEPKTNTVIVKLSDEPTNSGNDEVLTAAVLNEIALQQH